ncbi:MAG: hypothetical protein JXR37_32650 [Kiritimatiellae bacterium]|nr:hypothetical protein [Kiritimatiellia bacterium]
MMRRLAGCLLSAALAGAAACAEPGTEQAKPGRVELTFELPKPMFVGTPKNIRTPNLEPPRKGARPPLMVPEGTQLLSAGKPVTSSDDEPVVGEVEQVTDGDKEGAAGSYVELGPGTQHVQIDLEAVSAVHAILLWHFHAQARVYRDVIVQVADDPDFIMNVRTLYNNDHDNSSGHGIGKDQEYIETYEGRLIDAKGARARYVRLYSNGSTADEMNHYVEVEIYGKPAE